MTRWYLCPQAETCPGCGATTGVQSCTGTPKAQAWSCTGCGMSWAVSVVNPHLRAAYLADLIATVELLGAARRTLRQVIALAEQAPALSDRELRTRLLALAESCGAR